jgi:hypothetical protein
VARIPLDGEKCRPNLLFIVAPEKEALLELIRTTRPALFARMPAADLVRLSRGGPVAAWQVRDLKGLGGESLTASRRENQLQMLRVQRSKPRRCLIMKSGRYTSTGPEAA